MTQRRILVFAASNSRTSINRKLALHAGEVLCSVFEDAFELFSIDLNDFEMPIYSPERQANGGIPALAQRFYDHISAADGVIISFAEHNGSYAVAYKNVFDWCSRIDMKVYQDKPVLLLATSPGARGGQLVLDTAYEVLPYFGGQIVGKFKLPSFGENFDNDANAISEPHIAAELRRSVHALGSAILLD
ncbi:MAG: NAD(P)H-dependent oxidoreductase [Pseudomonadota bacterium]